MGHDTFDIKGKMTNQKSNEVTSFVPISLPEYVTKHHKDLTFSTDFFYVQGYPFFHAISKKIRLMDNRMVENRS